MPTDQDALLLSISANIKGLENQMKRAGIVVDQGATAAERRTQTMAKRMSESFGEVDIGKALEETFSRGRFAVLEEGGARIGLFGKALEELGPAGLIGAAGLAAVALGAEAVKKAVEEVGALSIRADRLGVSVKDLQEYEFAAKESHVQVDALDSSIAGLNVTLGKLRSGIGNERVQKLSDYLGFTPDELAQYKTATDFLPDLAEKIKALPSLAEQVAAAQKFGVEPILPLLVKGKEGVAELREEYSKLGISVSDDVARGVAKGNQEMEKAHEIAHGKLRNSLIELGPLLVQVSTWWDNLGTSAVNAYNRANGALNGFIKFQTDLANKDFNKNPVDVFMGRLNLAIARPTTTVMGYLGNQKAQDEMMFGPEWARPKPPTAGSKPGAAGGASPAGPTNAQIQAQAEATEKLAGLQAQLLDHATHRRDVEKQIAEIETKQGHAIDAQLKQRLLAAASAEDAAPGIRAADAAQRRKEAAERKAAEAAQKAQEKADRTQQAVDAADADALAARSALSTSLEQSAALAKDQVDADLKRKNDKLRGDIAEKKIDDLKGQQAITENELAAQDRKTLIDRRLADDLAQTQLQVAKAGVDAQVENLRAQDAVALTAGQRRDIELRILDLQQQEEKARLEAVLASQTATDAQKRIAQAQLDQLPLINAAQRSQVRANTRGPGETYVAELNKQIAEGNEQLKVDALTQFNDGLVQAIQGAKSLKDVFHDVALSIVTDLEKMAIQKYLTLPLAQALGLAGNANIVDQTPAPSMAGFTKFIPSLLNFLPGFAGGTSYAPGGLSIVGERGPELLNVPRGSQIIPNSGLGSMQPVQAGMSAPVVHQTVTFDNRGAIIWEDAQVRLQQYADNAAARAGFMAYQGARKDIPATMAKSASSRLGS